MKKTALILMFITIVTKIIGFLRDVILSYIHGASEISDAYLISTTIPATVFAFIGAGISTGYIPMYTTINKNFDNKVAQRFTTNLLNLVLLICTIIILLILFCADYIVQIFALGFEGETLELAIKLTKVGIFGIYFSGLVYIFNGYLNIKGKFVPTALIGIPLNLIIIVSIILSVKLNIMVLAIGSILSTVFQFLFLYPFVYKEGYRYSLVLDFKDKYLKKLIYLSLPVILGISVNEINILVDRTIASLISVGGISAITYANRINLFIQSIFVLSIVTVLFPKISKLAVEKNFSQFKNSISEAMVSVNLLLIPASVGCMIFSRPIVEFLFGRGAFNSDAVSMTSSALFFYSIGMIAVGLREVLARAFYSIQDTKTPMINAIIGLVLNIILNLTLSKFLGIGGLALATSISSIVIAILMFFSLRNKIGSFSLKNYYIGSIKILMISLVMGGISKLSFNFMLSSLNPNLSLLISIGVACISYFLIIYFTKIGGINTLVDNFFRKFFRKSEKS